MINNLASLLHDIINKFFYLILPKAFTIIKFIKFYLYFSQGVLFVYDMTNYQSFENVKDWLKYVKKFLTTNDDGDNSNKKSPKFALVANKGNFR